MDRLFLILAIFILASCQSVTVENFVHDNTEKSRSSLQWSNADPSLGIKPSEIQSPYIVPDFFQYWPGYSAQAFVYVVQRNTVLVKLNSISVASDTGESLNREIGFEAVPRKIEKDLMLYRYRVLDEGSANIFGSASVLTVTIKWSDVSGKEKRSVFMLKKIKRNETAWKS